MKSAFLRWNSGTLAATLLCTALSGCVTADGLWTVSGDAAYDTGDAGADTSADYYEPAGTVVGGWVPGYYVGPVGPGRDRDRGTDHGSWGGQHPPPGGQPNVPPHPTPGGQPSVAPHPMGGSRPTPTPSGGNTHAYTPAPASHPAPSIPTEHRK